MVSFVVDLESIVVVKETVTVLTLFMDIFLVVLEVFPTVVDDLICRNDSFEVLAKLTHVLHVAML